MSRWFATRSRLSLNPTIEELFAAEPVGSGATKNEAIEAAQYEMGTPYVSNLFFTQILTEEMEYEEIPNPDQNRPA